MSTVNFDQLFKDLETGAESLANEMFQDYMSQAKKDAQDAIDSMKADIQRWVIEVENGALTKEDLEFLLQEETELDEMKALKQAGLAAIQIDKFKNGLINMILKTLTSRKKVDT
ncbi:hypothetical protein [Segetibacter koreensis]|uniref:hypothetical protein n=1 Tax=Segetibacter koreensis TaxID=398037 RepID=UPI0003821708|nr:hypothetical protein [Segetibacter koreensis]